LVCIERNSSLDGDKRMIKGKTTVKKKISKGN